MDNNGYPDQEELDRVRKWKIESWQNALDLVEYIEGLWRWKEHCDLQETGPGLRELILSTGGWSGNEDIIEALADSMFWTLFWRQSSRGGHYVFKIDAAIFRREDG